MEPDEILTLSTFNTPKRTDPPFSLILTLKAPITTAADNILIFSLFFGENKSWLFMWIICPADNSHEKSKLVFSEKVKKYAKFRISSASNFPWRFKGLKSVLFIFGDDVHDKKHMVLSLSISEKNENKRIWLYACAGWSGNSLFTYYIKHWLGVNPERKIKSWLQSNLIINNVFDSEKWVFGNRKWLSHIRQLISAV